MSAAPYAIGSDLWPGISKVAEESNEVGQVVAKIIGYVIDRNHLDHDFITRHAGSKLTLFNKWHEENK